MLNESHFLSIFTHLWTQHLSKITIKLKKKLGNHWFPKNENIEITWAGEMNPLPILEQCPNFYRFFKASLNVKIG